MQKIKLRTSFNDIQSKLGKRPSTGNKNPGLGSDREQYFNK